MIDDSEDKLRRNLVVFAAAILGTMILQPKLAHNGQILGFIETKDVDPFRMWAVIAAILLYLIYRYWHSKARVDAWRHWTGFADSRANRFLERRLSDVIARGQAGEDVKHIVQIEPLNPRAAQPMPRAIKKVSVGLGAVFLQTNAHANYHIQFDTGPGLSGNFSYTAPRLETAWMYSKALCLTVFRTGSMGELCLPFMLAGAAAIVCSVELWTRWPWVFGTLR